MRLRDLVPDTCSDNEKWNKWRSDVGDYIETLESGMETVAKAAA